METQMEKMLTCSKCKQEKPAIEFSNNKAYLRGKDYYCKLCKDLSNKLWRDNNKPWISGYHQKYRKENAFEIRRKGAEYRQKNKEKRKAVADKWLQANREKMLAYWREYRIKNAAEIAIKRKQRKEKANAALRASLARNPQAKIARNLRRRLNSAIKGERKQASAVKDLGCNLGELKTHLESQFKEGMSWENYGSKGWHIDHIKPLSFFDLTIKENVLAACNYKNLQPLWWNENISKGNKC